VCLHVAASYEEHAWTPPCGIGFWQSPLADHVYPGNLSLDAPPHSRT
jgi:hypothetical protein